MVPFVRSQTKDPERHPNPFTVLVPDLENAQEVVAWESVGVDFVVVVGGILFVVDAKGDGKQVAPLISKPSGLSKEQLEVASSCQNSLGLDINTFRRLQVTIPTGDIVQGTQYLYKAPILRDMLLSKAREIASQRRRFH